MARNHTPEAIASRKAFYRAFWIRTAILSAAFWAEFLLVSAVRHGGAVTPSLWNPLSYPALIYHGGLMPGVNAWIFVVMTAVIFVTTVRTIPLAWLIPTALSFAPLAWWLGV
ncbi:hypothetical protein SAMN05444156_0316 [Verrucomicrobium sp. GAS474]|uniref:hypothetical protein n=1 Tax=Verrucomicrobium sp. GAS474 TaxID=1882831 RepID=UPI000879382E|nr:hypothetical protein [Verrucomicrobium sp. GAS474]SDT87521.1 hypothetical protein SAMN05444156_0316 [Verrucomicrobium sp. GAS474]